MKEPLRRVESKVVCYVRNERARQALLSANEQHY